MDVHNITQYNTRQRLLLYRYKKIIIGIIFSFIVMLIGWYYWHIHHTDHMIAASSTWQMINVTLNNEADEIQLSKAQYFVDNNYNSYGALTLISLAKQYVHKGEFTTAEKKLQQALNYTQEVNLQSIINLQLARIQLQLKNTDHALKTLENIKESEWEALAEDIRGDIQVSKGDYKAARIAYEKALRSGASSKLLRIKLNNLPK